MIVDLPTSVVALLLLNWIKRKPSKQRRKKLIFFSLFFLYTFSFHFWCDFKFYMMYLYLSIHYHIKKLSFFVIKLGYMCIQQMWLLLIKYYKNIWKNRILNEGIINAFVMSCSSLLKNMMVLHSQKHSIFFIIICK